MKKYQKKTLRNLMLTIGGFLFIPIFLFNIEKFSSIIFFILFGTPAIIALSLIFLFVFQILSSTILSFLLSLYLTEDEYETYHEIASKSYRECLYMDSLDCLCDMQKERLTEIKQKVEKYLNVNKVSRKVLRIYYNHFVKSNLELFVTGV